MFPDRARRVIAETFGVIYADSSGVWRLLKAMGWSVQVPARRAVERNEGAIAAWIEQTWPQIEKKGVATGAWILSEDEAGGADSGAARGQGPSGEDADGRGVLLPPRSCVTDAVSYPPGVVSRP